MKKDILQKATAKKWGLTAIALFLCMGIGLLAYAKSDTDEPAAEEPTAAAEAEAESEAPSDSIPELSEEDLERLDKEEAVYVIADASGSPQKLIVSDHLKNIIGSGSVSDETGLTDITNIKGSETFKKDGSGLLNWNAQGNDIYYNGTIEKELPIDLQVSYLLDGQEISPEELAGKSGHVTIRFDYTNRQRQTVTAGDEALELYVPFITITGLVLDNDHFRNVEMTNGRIIDDGSRTIAVGYAIPGLADNLKIDSEEFSDELDIPEYAELSADVTDFELPATMTIAENKLFGEIEIDEDGKLDELSNDMDELQDAMNELMDGTGELYDGVLELYDGTQELVDGINELYDGSGELYNGTEDLYDGSEELHDGVKELCTGLSQLTGNNAALQAGATEVFNTLLNTVDTEIKNTIPSEKLAAMLPQVQAKAPELVDILTDYAANGLTISNYDAVLGALGQLSPMLSSVSLNSAANMGMSTSYGTFQFLSANELPQTPAIIEGEEADKEGDQKDVDITPDLESEPEKSQDSQNTENAEQNTDETVPQNTLPEEKLPETDESPDNESDVPKDTENISETPETNIISPYSLPQPRQNTMSSEQITATLKAAKDNLDKYNEFYQGLLKYLIGVSQAEQGADKLHDGAHELRDGAKELRDGASELRDGAGELKDGGQELNDGVLELRDGSKELDDGTHEFNEEGIQKLVDIFDGDVQELKDRLDGTKAAALTYRSFSGISDQMDGSVRFIYKTDEIEK